MANQKKTVTPYKYPLYDLLYKKYGANYLTGKKEIAQSVIKMSLATINADFGIKRGADTTIPHPRLKLYADHFGVDISTLQPATKKRRAKAA